MRVRNIRQQASSAPVYEKLAAGLRSYASLRLLTQIVSWLGSIYVIRHVGHQALGRYAVALVVFNYLTTAYDGTLLEALIQRPPATAEDRRAVFSLLIGIGLVLVALVAASATAIGRLIGDNAVSPLIFGIAIALGLASFCVMPQAALARQMAFPRLATIGAVQAVCVTVSMVTLAWAGAGAWALVSGQVIGAALRLVLLNSSTSGFARPTWRIKEALRYLRFGGVLFVDNVLWRWYTSLDTVLLGRWAGTQSLGFYSLAQQVSELPLEKISTVVNEVSLPAYAELRGNHSSTAELLLETIRMHATAGFPLFWGLAAVADYFISVAFGTEWAASIFPLVALAAVAPLRLIGSTETPAMTGLGCPEVLLRTKLVIVPCMTVSLVVGCRLDGINGVAMAWIATFPLCQAIAFRYVLRAARLSYKEVLAVVRGPAVGAAAMVAIVLGWQHVIAPVSSSPWVRLASAVAVGALAYGSILRLLDPRAFRLAQSRFGRVVGPRRAA